MNSTVTVLINTVNEVPERLRRTITSFKTQERVDVVILISTVKDDISIEIAKEMDCRVVVSKAKGIYQQLNNAVNYIRTDWWCYSSGHDIALPGKLYKEIQCCLDNNKYICYSDYFLVDPETNTKSHIKFNDYDYQKHLTGNFINDCSMIYTSFLKQYLPFRNDKWGNDSHYDLWLRVYEGAGNVYCHNDIPSWEYIQYNDSKHIVRQKSDEELEQYRILRRSMIDSHIKRPVLTVGLPTYKSKLAWFAIESLCRQKVNVPWELVIGEDQAEANGEKYYRYFEERLKKANCISIKYISIPRQDSIRDRIALSLKWKIIANASDQNSIGLVMQDSDDYSEPNRLQKTYDRFKEGYHWIHSRRGIFYNLDSHKTILFDLNTIGQHNTGLNKAVSLELARQLPEEVYYSSVDNWIFRSISKIRPFLNCYYDESDDYLNGLFTDGVNIISKNREQNYIQIKYPFMETEKRPEDCIPEDVICMLEGKERITQCVVSKSVEFFEDMLFDKFNFTNRRKSKEEAFVIDKNRPLVAFGCYVLKDFKRILEHNSNVVIIWAGSDSMSHNHELMKQFVGRKNIHHISGSKFISNDLEKLGLEYDYYPISLFNHDMIKVKPLGNKIYIYTARGKNDPEFYGKSIYDKLIEKYGKENFIIANADTYPKEVIYELYEKCFVGLRLVKHDGLSETVAELGLMGRNVIYNGDTPNSLNYNNIEDIIEHIENEKKKIGYIDISLSNSMAKFLNISKEWLYVEKQTFTNFNKNSLGCAYSVFDDLEHLEQSLCSIKSNVDFITVVYQNTSYTGSPASYNIYQRLKELMSKNLIDNIQEYRPDFTITTKGNEVRKRNLGLEICRQYFCTHYITMDGDEIFISEEFKKAKEIVYDYDYLASFIFSKTYYKTKNHIVYPPETYHIPFIYKITAGKFKLDAKIEGIIADKSRKMTDIEKDFIVFDREYIEMHHLCYLRNDLKRKLENKASNLSDERIEIIMNSFDNFDESKIDQSVITENGYFNIRKLQESKV